MGVGLTPSPPAGASRHPGAAGQTRRDRDARMTHVLRALEGQGLTQEDVMRTIADALGLSYETVRSAVRRVRETGLLGEKIA